MQLLLFILGHVSCIDRWIDMQRSTFIHMLIVQYLYIYMYSYIWIDVFVQSYRYRLHRACWISHNNKLRWRLKQYLENDWFALSFMALACVHCGIDFMANNSKNECTIAHRLRHIYIKCRGCMNDERIQYYGRHSDFE